MPLIFHGKCSSQLMRIIFHASSTVKCQTIIFSNPRMCLITCVILFCHSQLVLNTIRILSSYYHTLSGYYQVTIIHYQDTIKLSECIVILLKLQIQNYKTKTTKPNQHEFCWRTAVVIKND